MKKYISILMIALVASVTISCQLEGGTDPDTNRANRLLWHRVLTALGDSYRSIEVVAQLNDHLRDIIYEESPRTPYEIEGSEGVYTLTLRDNTTEYKVNTYNKRLDEGGEWVLYIRYGTYMEWMKLGIIKGVEGEGSKFSIAIDDTPYSRYDFVFRQQAEIEYSYDNIAKELLISLSNVEGIVNDHRSLNDITEYVIEYNTYGTLLYKGGELDNGEVDILYKDLIDKSERAVTVKIENKIITFATAQERIKN